MKNKLRTTLALLALFSSLFVIPAKTLAACASDSELKQKVQGFANSMTTCNNIEDSNGKSECKKGVKTQYDNYTSSQKNCRCASLSGTSKYECEKAFDTAISSEKTAFTKEYSSAGKYTATGNTIDQMVDTDYELSYDSSPCKNDRIALAVSVVGKVVDIIKIVAPIILVLMATIDILKSVMAGDDSKMEKSKKMLIKRIISAVIIFFVIAIVQLICNLVGKGAVDESCMKIIANPWSVSTNVK